MRMLHHRCLPWAVVVVGLACNGTTTEGDDQTPPTVAFADPQASFLEDPPEGEFTIRIVVTDPVAVAKVGVQVGPAMGAPNTNVIGRTIYSPDSPDITVTFSWAEVDPLFFTGTGAKKIDVSVVAVDVFGNQSDPTVRQHTLRSRELWTLRPQAERTLYPVFVDSTGSVWVGTGQIGDNGRIVRIDPFTGMESCAVGYVGEPVTAITEAVGAGPTGEDLIVFGTLRGLRAVMRDSCTVSAWDYIDSFAYTGSPVHDAARGRIVALNTAGQIVQLNPTTGAVLFIKSELGAAYSVSPAVTADGNILAGSSNNNIYRLGADMMPQPSIVTLAIQADPIIVGDLVYFGSRDGNVYEIDNSTGRLTPNSPFSVALGDAVSSRPAIAPDGTVLATTLIAQKLFAFNPTTGIDTWNVAIGSVTAGGAVVRDDGGGNWTAYIGNASGVISAIDQGGNVLWRLEAADPITNYGTIERRRLYINTRQTVHAIDVGPPDALP